LYTTIELEAAYLVGAVLTERVPTGVQPPVDLAVVADVALKGFICHCRGCCGAILARRGLHMHGWHQAAETKATETKTEAEAAEGSIAHAHEFPTCAGSSATRSSSCTEPPRVAGVISHRSLRGLVRRRHAIMATRARTHVVNVVMA